MNFNKIILGRLSQSSILINNLKIKINKVKILLIKIKSFILLNHISILRYI